MAEPAYLLMYAAAAFAGIIAGMFTGILPGLHINLVAVIVASIFYTTAVTASSHSLAVAIFLLAMSISHVFHEFLPSVFLGFSESDAALAVLPGHRMLLEGQGRKAVLLAAFGGLAGVMALVMLSPLLLLAIKPLFYAAKDNIGLILIAVIAVHFLKNRRPKTFAISALVLLLSGSFGIAVFSLPSIREPLLPMFAGLFGLSSLISGLLNRSSFPPQQQTAAIKVKNPLKAAKLLAVGIFSSSLMGMFPALGPAQAAMIGTATLRRISAPAYMFLLGVISSASMLFAVLTLYSFGKARNGSIAVMGDMIGITGNSVIMLLVVAVIAAALSCVSVIYISRLFSAAAKKTNYQLLSFIVIIFLIAAAAVFSGAVGLLVLSVATAIGMVPVLTRSSRQLLMACLMVPVIGYYM
ncbi:tripartite tricarboxylate transporter permease [Candidatus Woesearchaeota archaeon]|nr:tripartite tricarboxylate transporter permease [Candidatus Woesearchaeota archaeon]